MVRYSCRLLLMMWVISIWTHVQAQTLAFPSAEGFGRFAKGGRGGRVIEVTNLNADGPGSFKACILASGPRTCIFQVSGIIDLPEQIKIENPYLTIAGQTAPGDGVLIKGAWMGFNTHDVIIRHLRARPGNIGNVNGVSSWKALSSVGGENIIFDHCSVGWSTDDTMSFHNSTNVTIQWCFFAEGLVNPSGRALLIRQGNTGFSVLHNLLAHYPDRMPLMTSGSVQIVNNVAYNVQGRSNVHPVHGPVNVEYIKNYYQQGSNTSNIYSTGIGASGTGYKGVPENYANNSGIHLKGNFHSELRPNDTLPEDSLVRQYESGLTIRTSPFGYPAIPSETDALQAKEEVLALVGARVPSQSPVDIRVINDVKNGTGRSNFIQDPSEVGGYPDIAFGTRPADYDKDHDGMPDSWEVTHGLNPNDPTDGPETATNGYTNLENYLNELAGDLVPGLEPSALTYTILKTSTPINIDGDLSEFNDVPEITLTNIVGSTGIYKLLWDENFIYISAQVAEDQLNANISTHDGTLYQDDSIELFFDTLNNKGISQQNDDFKFFVNILNTQGDFNNFDGSFEAHFSSLVKLNGSNNNNADVDYGYVMELAIPWNSLNISTPQEGLKLGFDLAFNDKRGDGSRTSTPWANSTGGGLNDPSGWGVILLSGQLRVASNFNPPANLRIISR